MSIQDESIARDSDDKNPPKDLSSEETIRGQWDLAQQITDINKKILMEASELLFSAHNGFFKFSSPLTIFSPEIVQNALSDMLHCFNEKLKHDPKPLHDIGLTHFEKFQGLCLSTLSHMLGEPFEPVIAPQKNDKRFLNPLWESNPYFSFLKQSHLLSIDFVHNILDELDTLAQDTKIKLGFYAKQLTHSLSPTNFPMTNPDVIVETLKTQGENLRTGMENLAHDIEKGKISMTDMRAFRLGENLATTPGDVVFENDILQLIRYHPREKIVYSIPLLIIPAWINKYYIFDLTEQKSFVRWCIDRGMDVYVLSWINPTKDNGNNSLCDYILQGVYEAVKQCLETSKTKQINALGYCAGGIALNCLLAYLEAQKIPSPFKSATTLASPIDANALGDIRAFICQKQLNLLDESIDAVTIIPGHILTQSFNLLRPSELLWSFYIKHYLLGKPLESFDLLFWNCDSVNLPGRMHSHYLRHIFLDNKLTKPGAMKVAGVPIDLRCIKTPSFIVGAEKDHIVPWRSIFPLVNLINSPIKEFLLAGSGHISGIMNHPQAQKYQYWVNPSLNKDPLKWKEQTKEHLGSWWNYWLKWMGPFLGEMTPYTPSKEIIEPAPGRYVLRGASL